jgi:hypothetical protein
MSIIGKILDIFGPGGNNFYARDFRNAYTFRPDQNPPRQKFQGYVSFVVNRELYGSTLYGNDVNSTFRLRLGSLVRTATLPEVEFKTETKNSYNRKRIVNTGIEYQPVDIKVFDTINNEWLTMFMKYFSYHYMNPRNKQFGGEREVGSDPRQSSTSQQYVGSEFGSYGENKSWNSNAYGYNLNELANFFERIDYVLYHGNKGVQYSLINPVLTRFKTGEIDYASSDVMEFDMTFEYESFTLSEQVNFGLSEFDIARFENAKDFKGPAFVPFNVPVLLQERKLEMLTGFKNAEGYARTLQQQPVKTTSANTASANASTASQSQSNETTQSSDSQIVVTATRANTSTTSSTTNNTLPSVYGKRATFANPAEKDKSFIEGLLGNIADNALSAAIHGTSIKNAVINTAVGGITQGIVNTVRPPVRGTRTQPNAEAETASASTSEKPAVKPGGTT